MDSLYLAMMRSSPIPPPGLSVTKTNSDVVGEPSLTFDCLARTFSLLGTRTGATRSVRFRLTEEQIQALGGLGIKEDI